MDREEIVKKVKAHEYSGDLFQAIIDYDGNAWGLIRSECYPGDSAEYKELEEEFKQWKHPPKKNEQKELPADPEDEIIPPNIDVVKALLDVDIKMTKDGDIIKKPKQTIENHETVLLYDTRLSMKIRFNEFAQREFLVGRTPWIRKGESTNRPWTNYDDSNAFMILQSNYGLRDRKDYQDAVKIVSHMYKYHPVRDFLNGLEWDGKEHIRHILTDYLGVEPTEYNYQVFRLWVLGAVARIFRPGCKFDFCLILQGRQGIGKSTFLQNMAIDDAWFNDSLDSLDGNAAIQCILGSWIIELAELKSLARTSGGSESVKRFISARQDKIRLSYERRDEIFPRQCIFAGSTNKADFLQDETGNRRFLIVQVGIREPTKDLFDPDCMEDFRQTWAEAVHIYKTEQPRLILAAEYQQQAKMLQEQFKIDDGSIGQIESYLEGKDRVCILEIWQEALGENGRPPKWKSTEIKDTILHMGGWQVMKYPMKFGVYGNQRGLQRIPTTTNYKQIELQKLQSEGFIEISPDDENIFT